MKYFLTICISGVLLTGCKKSEEPKVQPPDTVTSVATALSNAIEHQDKNSLKNHKGAMEAIANLPEGGPIPPHLLPAKDITLVEATDSTALYTFVAGQNKINAT